MVKRGNHRQDTQYKKPPELELLFEGQATLSEPLEIGDTPAGHRLIVPIEAGGRVDGPRMHGSFLAGSATTHLKRADGVIQLRSRLLLGMDDGHIVLMHSKGLRRMSAEAVEALVDGRPYDPSSLHTRTFVWMEAEKDGPYAWLNRGLFITNSIRTVDEVWMSCWEIL